jgi:hypothetical protein
MYFTDAKPLMFVYLHPSKRQFSVKTFPSLAQHTLTTFHCISNLHDLCSLDGTMKEIVEEGEESAVHGVAVRGRGVSSPPPPYALIKKKIKFSSYIRKF